MTTRSVPEHAASLYRRVLGEPTNVALVAELALALADSGSRRPLEPDSVDIASSGGPSSLSTLLCPLYLVAKGRVVPKVGVVGRPAGGIDVLGTIPNYRVELSRAEFDACVTNARYVHVEAGATWAPDDAALFALRQADGTQANPALAIASLLAKKVAVGVDIAGLDARISPHGNFGRNLGEARKSADLFCEVGAQLGLRPVVVLTGATVPYQPFIGRGEALSALATIVSGRVVDGWLAQHASMCHRLADLVTSTLPGSAEGTPEPPAHLLSAALDANLTWQGAKRQDLEARIASVAEDPRRVVAATTDGYVHYHLGRMRDWVVRANKQSDRITADGPAFPDRAGVRLLCPPGRWVRRGEAVLEVRGDTLAADPELDSMFVARGTPSGRPNEIHEVIRH